jgi:hypothetical protein
MQYLLILSMTDSDKKVFNTLHFSKQLEWKMLENLYSQIIMQTKFKYHKSFLDNL